MKNSKDIIVGSGLRRLNQEWLYSSILWTNETKTLVYKLLIKGISLISLKFKTCYQTIGLVL